MFFFFLFDILVPWKIFKKSHFPVFGYVKFDPTVVVFWRCGHNCAGIYHYHYFVLDPKFPAKFRYKKFKAPWFSSRQLHHFWEQKFQAAEATSEG